MERHIRDEGVRPDVVLCSTAARTRQTFDLVAPALEGSAVEFEPELYGAGAESLLARLRGLPDDVGSAMLIGHTPGLHDLALGLACGGERLPDLEAKYPTGALATLDFDGPAWHDLAPEAARLTAYVTPRELEG